MKIRIGLFGLGKTGRVVAQSLFQDDRFELAFAAKDQVLQSNEFEFVVKPKELIDELLNQFEPEMIVDLTKPEAVMSNIEKLHEKTGYLIATTGFTETQLNLIKKYEHLKVLYAPNISDGINVLIKACELFNEIWNHADVEIVEQHFKSKEDLPSGTARKIAKIFDKEVSIHSIRAGGIVGVLTDVTHFANPVGV
jgi:4-hydroxy-tetrahydrodipicolinate reductase